MRKKKILIVFIIIMLSTLVLTSCKKETPKDSFIMYKNAWEEKDYEKMYDMLSISSKDYIEKQDFINRYKNIYDGIEAKDIKINIREDQLHKDDREEYNFNLKMNTLAGEIAHSNYKVKMIKEKIDKKDRWNIEWNESLIFPDMKKDDQVRVGTLRANRGEIYDRDKNPLAANGIRYNIGIHPAKYNTKDTSIMAKLLDVNEEKIEKELEKNTDPDHFVPIVKISIKNENLLNELLMIEGVQYIEVNDRVYQEGEAFGSLVGYIRPITKEELDADEDGIYNNISLIGKAGLEKVYENILRGKDGKEIYISKAKNEEGPNKIVLVKTDLEDGKDITVTVDSDLQKMIYEEMKEDVGATTAIDPKTGEILSIVSYPSYDSNIYTTYISNTQSELWVDTDVNVFENRFNSSYSPGSTFKVVTAAIGLESGAIDPLEKINIAGKSWKKDKSWGNYEISRVSEDLTDLDLNDAFIYSDNIYFARSALEIGGKDFLEGAKSFGFGEKLPIEYPFAKSQIFTEEKIDNEILLADTGYGQGEVLVSPLHLSLIYSSLLNEGNMMKPTLEIKEDGDFEIWKNDIMSEQNREIILNSLIDVIEDENGTGHGAKLDGVRLAGKTGTAELKLTQEGRGKENGWFVLMDIDEANIVISAMVEGVEDKGGSYYVVSKVKNVMADYLKDK